MFTVDCCTQNFLSQSKCNTACIAFFVPNIRFQGIKYLMKATIPLANNPHLKPRTCSKAFSEKFDQYDILVKHLITVGFSLNLFSKINVCWKQSTF